MEPTLRFLKKITFGFCLATNAIFILSDHAKAQSFTTSTLNGASTVNPTSLQFGPDGKLYVAQQDGAIKIFTINRAGANNYQATGTETILLVKQIPNHYDDGTAKPYNINSNKRLVTGLLVAGTSVNPVIYVSSSDPDMGAGNMGDVNLCTNSGIISKLYKESGTWKKVDLVRGLPRSEENHANNGMQIHNNMLYVAMGGHTNAGGVSKLFAYHTEYALSACIISIDLNQVEGMSLKANGDHPYKYDLPTLDDPTRANVGGKDVNDPFGGNDGLNQAKLDPAGPVQIFATGLRNVYDLVITKTPGKENRMYTVDNGANQNWGGFPVNVNTANVNNNYDPAEPGSSGSGGVNNLDGLHYIGRLDTYTPGSYYGGHPCPIRANPSGAGLYTHTGSINEGTGVWRTSTSHPTHPLPADWPPVPVSMANPAEANFLLPGVDNAALLTFNTSTNGICEYSASNFGGAMQGDLLACGFNGHIYRIKLNGDGTESVNAKGGSKLNQDLPLATGFGNKPLDVTAQGDGDVFPGTIWVAVYGAHTIAVFEPQDLFVCTGANDASLDEDGDGWNNAEEIANGTDPCNAASRPEDFDGDGVSDLWDDDDDGDGIVDWEDLFARDAQNGLATHLPTHYHLFNFDPGTGFFGLGFTGLMCNGVTDYMNLYENERLIAGGAIGAFTILDVPASDAYKNMNNQEYGFQFGVNVSTATGNFFVKSALLAHFFNNQTPQNHQSQGLYIGTGDQDNYLKIVLNANGGAGGIQVVYEENGIIIDSNQYAISYLPSNTLEVYFMIHPHNGQVFPKFSYDGGPLITLGNPITVGGPLLQAIQDPEKAMAIGVIATSRESGQPFNATWDYIVAVPENLNAVRDLGADNDAGINVYPNPFNNHIVIDFKPGHGRNASVKIYDETGRHIEDIEIQLQEGYSGTEISLSHLDPGLYIIQVISKKNMISKSFRMIKNQE